MEESEKMSCGACGCSTFKLYGGTVRGWRRSIVAKCNKCGSTTVIRPSEPTLELDWGGRDES